MLQAIKAGDLASCEHPCTGSLNVFINGLGATRVGVDAVETEDGGLFLIDGPGAPTVLINGAAASLPGDSIKVHGDPTTTDEHDVAKTVASPDTTVYIT